MSACVSLEPFALRVLDDSMAPDLPAGAVVVVDPGEPPEDGSLVVLEHEGEVRLRRLRLEAPPAGEAGRARFVSPAGPDLAPEGGWRRAVRGVVTGVRLPRAKRAVRPPRGRREGSSDRPAGR